MRYILMLALFFTCLSAASAADDPVTQPNNDASTPALFKLRLIQPFPRSSHPVVKPDAKDLGPTK